MQLKVEQIYDKSVGGCQKGPKQLAFGGLSPKLEKHTCGSRVFSNSSVKAVDPMPSAPSSKPRIWRLLHGFLFSASSALAPTDLTFLKLVQHL